MLSNIFYGGNLKSMRWNSILWNSKDMESRKKRNKNDLTWSLNDVIFFTLGKFLEDFRKKLNVHQIDYEEGANQRGRYSLSFFVETRTDSGEPAETLFLVIVLDIEETQLQKSEAGVFKGNIEAKVSEEIKPYYRKYYKFFLGEEPKIVSEEEFNEKYGNDEWH